MNKTKQRARVICAFPGLGKSTFTKKHNGENGLVILDSDSSDFSWVWNLNHTRKSNVRNLDFPNNYIKHIRDNLDSADIIFVSTHKEVVDALLKTDIEFEIVLPSSTRKEELLKLYKDRGSDNEFINKMDENWNKWLNEYISMTMGFQLRSILGCDIYSDYYRGLASLPDNKFMEDYINGNI